MDITTPLTAYFKGPVQLIGLSGWKRSGKDTVAAHLEAKHGFVRESFAKPLKQAAMLIYGWSADDLEDGARKEAIDPEWGVSPRKVMQLLGTEVGRTLDTDLWIKSMYRRLRRGSERANTLLRAAEMPLSIVISDVRFGNEADFVRTLGGEVWRLTRPSQAANTDPHPSETALDKYTFDRVLLNDGTVQDLERLVDTVLSMPQKP